VPHWDGTMGRRGMKSSFWSGDPAAPDTRALFAGDSIFRRAGTCRVSCSRGDVDQVWLDGGPLL